jgi:4-hydroxybenzoate polyprenyltransferase
LVFLPAVAAHDASTPTWLAAVLAFIAFSLVASSDYVLNDLLDLSADRAHPRKRNRPLASGALPPAHGTLMVPGLLLLGGGITIAVGSLEFLGVMLAYYVLTMGCSLLLKRKVVIDICTLARGFTR